MVTEVTDNKGKPPLPSKRTLSSVQHLFLDRVTSGSPTLQPGVTVPGHKSRRDRKRSDLRPWALGGLLWRVERPYPLPSFDEPLETRVRRPSWGNRRVGNYSFSSKSFDPTEIFRIPLNFLFPHTYFVNNDSTTPLQYWPVSRRTPEDRSIRVVVYTQNSPISRRMSLNLDGPLVWTSENLST